MMMMMMMRMMMMAKYSHCLLLAKVYFGQTDK